MLQHHDVRLIAADGCQHVLRPYRGGEALRMSQGGHAFVVPPELRERDARQRVHQREMAAVAGCVQR
jgi:hypothetical protein